MKRSADMAIYQSFANEEIDILRHRAITLALELVERGDISSAHRVTTHTSRKWLPAKHEHSMAWSAFFESTYLFVDGRIALSAYSGCRVGECAHIVDVSTLDTQDLRHLRNGLDEIEKAYL